MSIVGTSSQTPRFSPDTLPGCSLWLDGADPAGTGSPPSIGTSVSTWVDKSGNGRNGISEGTSIPTFSNRGITYNGSGFYRTSYSAALPEETLFVVFRWASIGNNGPAFIGGTQWYQRLMYVDPAESRWLYYGGIASWGRWNTSPLSLNVDYMFGVTWNSSSVIMHLNGSPLATAGSSGSIASFSGSPTDSIIGGGINGTMYEMIGYNTVLTTAQRQQVEGYLARKWGISEMIGHPYRFGGSGILPTQISGCTLWLDAADATTLTLSGSNVTAWRNKSGAASLTLFGTAPTYVSNQVVFNASGRFRGAYALTTQTTMFVVYSTSNTTTNARLISVDGNYYGNVHAPTPYEGTDLFVYDGGSGGYWSTLPPQTGLRMYTIGFNGVNSMIWRNGSAATLTGTRAAGPATGSNISVGADLDGQGPFNGAISELILFSAALTDTQRQQIEGYLANKWGLSTALPAPTTNTPYAGAIIPMRAFSPLDIDGLSMWLDATDRDTLTLSGSNVTAWADKSGRGYSLTVPSGGYTSPTYSNGVVTTTGSNALWSTSNFEISGNTPVTLFLVGSITSSADLGPGATLGLAVGDAGNRQSFGVITYQDSTRTFLFAPTTIEPDSYVILTPNISGQRYVLCGFYTGSAVQGTYNGTLMSSQATTLNLAARPFQIGMRNANTGTSSAGTICECICYTGALSTTQRQQVEMYLADKWGLRGSMGGVSHPHRFGPPVILPTQIPGCAFWLDATDSTSMTLSGSNLSQWRDKSSNGFAGTAVSSPTLQSNSINGLPAVQFNGSSQYINFGNVLNIGTSHISVFAVTRFTGSAGVVGKGNYCVTFGRWGLYRYESTATMYVDNSPNPGGVANFANSTTTTQLLAGSWDRTTVTGLQNGVQQGSASFSSSSNFSNTHLLIVGGFVTCDATAGVPGFFLNGVIGEVLVYLGALTTTQRQQVEGYLAWKWGLNTSLASPTTSWLQMKRALTPAFTPNQIPGCSLWLDAADATTLTLSGSNVTAWADKSGNGASVSQGTTSNQPTVSSNGLVFSGNQWFPTSITSAPTDESLFVVLTVASNATYDIFSGTQSGFREFILYDGAFRVGKWGTTPSGLNSGAIPIGSRMMIAYQYTQTTTTLSLTGATTSGSTPYTYGGSGTSWIGAASYAPNNFVGTINELVYYNRTVTNSERQRIEGYLAEKWGLRGSLGGLNHPSRFGPPMILPTQISGCTLWLDAADATTFTLSGSNVTQWRDKSGNGNHATTATGTLARSSNSVVFTGSQAMTTTLSSVMTTQTIFVVASANSNAFMDLLGVNSATMTTGIQYLIGTNYTQRVTRYGGTMIFDVGGTVSQNANFLYGATYTSGGDSVLYLNGSQTRTTSSSPTISGSGATVLIGAYSDGTYGELYVGTMSEIVIYNQVLSTAQRQQVEGYLAWKWGLQANLPTSTHPYKAIKP